MKPPPQFAPRLPRWHEWLIYSAAALLLVTGVVWLLLDRFGKVQGEFGPEPHPALPWLLMIHGVAAYAFVVLAAMLLPVHIRLGWNLGRNRRSGLVLIGVSLLLVLTGLALYYSTAEGLRSAMSVAHWAVGLGLPLLLIIHLVRGKSGVRRRSVREDHRA